MQQAVPINLKERVIKALTTTDSELWFPHLTFDLMRSGLNKLYEETGITEPEYGTARVIYKNPDAQRFREGAIYTLNEREEIRDESFVEMLTAEIAFEYNKQGVEFYDDIELFRNKEIGQCLRDAFEIIRHIPTLFTSVRRLVKSIHLIKPEDDDYDVSFSEPHIPFSIFVSVPRKNTPINALRVAEAIIHEAMHLQLTLIESIVPLVMIGDELVYSPWKDEYRTPQGVLHAIYVFRVIERSLKHFLTLNNLKDGHAKYVEERYLEIEKQMQAVEPHQMCSSLTELGLIFTTRLIFK